MGAVLADSAKASTDGFPPLTLRGSAPVIALAVFTLFMSVLSSRYWPQRWKCFVVEPLLKNVDKKLLQNYRPISKLSKLSLVFERLIFNFIYKKIRGKINSRQHGRSSVSIQGSKSRY